MSESPNTLAALSPDAKRKLLAELLREKADNSAGGLSYGQRALWYLHHLDPQSAFYNVPWSWWVRSELDVDALHRAFQALVDRHRILRTTYPEQGGRRVAKVLERASVDFAEIPAADWNDEQLQRSVSVEAHLPFDLECGPVMRVRVFTRGPSEHVLLVTFHHIVYDLWSMMTLLNELGALYAAHRSGVRAALPAAPQYAEFIRWQADMLARGDGERMWLHWQQQMAG